MPGTSAARHVTHRRFKKSKFNKHLLPSRERLLKLCRVCGQSRNETRCLSALQPGIVKDHLLKYLNIKVQKDGLPHLVCPTCAQVLIDWDFVIKTSCSFELALATLHNMCNSSASHSVGEVTCSNTAALDKETPIHTENLELVDNRVVVVAVSAQDSNQKDISENNFVRNDKISDDAAGITSKYQDICNSAVNSSYVENSGVSVSNVEHSNKNVHNEVICTAPLASEFCAVDSISSIENSDLNVACTAAVASELCNSAVDTNDVENPGESVNNETVSAAALESEICNSAVASNNVENYESNVENNIACTAALASELCETVKVKTEVDEEATNNESYHDNQTEESITAAQNQLLENQINNLKESPVNLLTIKDEPLEDFLDFTQPEPSLSLQSEVDSLIRAHLPIIETETANTSEQFVIDNPIPRKRRKRGRPKKDTLAFGYTSKHKKNPVARSIITKYSKRRRATVPKQLTFNLNDNADVSKITQYQQVHVMIEPVHVQPKEKTNDERNKSDDIGNLRNKIKASLSSNKKTQYCILCKCNVTHYIEHLEDKHIENPIINEILNDHNTKLHNKLSNSALNVQKQQLIGHHQPIIPKIDNLLPINSIEMLCFNKILELLPENIRNIIKNDKLIHRFGIHLIELSSVSNTKLFTIVTYKLKQIVKLLIQSKQTNPYVKDLGMLLTEDYCTLIFDSLKFLGNFNHESATYKNPSIVKQIGNSIKQCAKIYRKLDLKYRETQYHVFVEMFKRLWENELILARNSVILNSVISGNVRNFGCKRKSSTSYLQNKARKIYNLEVIEIN